MKNSAFVPEHINIKSSPRKGKLRDGERKESWGGDPEETPHTVNSGAHSSEKRDLSYEKKKLLERGRGEKIVEEKV